MSRNTVALRYGTFACISTAVNMGLQWAILNSVDGRFVLYAAISAGTAGGVLVKYLLDCRFIFAYRNRPRAESLLTFVLYALMSAITTVVFWGTELLFDALSSAVVAKYAGAAVGLTLGYTLKYHLDKRFVFSRRTS